MFRLARPGYIAIETVPRARSANVPVEQLSGHNQKASGNVGNHLPGRSGRPARSKVFGIGRWASPVCQRRTLAAPAVFESYQPRVVTIGPPQVKFLQPVFFGFLYGPPEEKRHPAVLAEPCVGATVLVTSASL